eukprot:3903516-Pleurochrysis_carterae.AAC.1
MAQGIAVCVQTGQPRVGNANESRSKPVALSSFRTRCLNSFILLHVSRCTCDSRAKWHSLHVLSVTDLSFPFSLSPLWASLSHVLESYGLANVF